MNEYSVSAAQSRLDDYDFEMFSKEGEDAVREHLRKIIQWIESTPRKITPELIDEKINLMMEKVSKEHEEVYDTEPAYHIRWHIAKCLDDNFYNYQSFNLVGKL
jgi:hypothetical protein